MYACKGMASSIEERPFSIKHLIKYKKIYKFYNLKRRHFVWN